MRPLINTYTHSTYISSVSIGSDLLSVYMTYCVSLHSKVVRFPSAAVLLSIKVKIGGGRIHGACTVTSM